MHRYISKFNVPKMDCPCEESLIRLKLENSPLVERLDFDLAERTLVVVHHGEVESIQEQLETLNLGAKLTVSSPCDGTKSETTSNVQRKALRWVLVINFLCFIIEATTGIISQSMGLVADSLDMLADALVYGMSLMAVGTTVARQQKVAKLSGYLQISLAVLGLIEVVKRFVGLETPPDFLVMIVISFIALMANTASLWLLQRTKSKEAHIQASVIFSANDVIVNIGVIVAGLLVGWLNSNTPDLIIGIIVFLIVIRGAIRILKLSK
ncbi:MAG: cation transporter [Alloprevotella sp.]|nr:cation transporter [Alloprevotella sp.]